MRYVDAHVHLADPEFEDRVENVTADARRAGVVALVSSSVDLSTSLRNIELASEYPQLVYAALGIHPWNIKELRQGDVDQVVGVISSHGPRESIVAIGEIGLDYTYARQDGEQIIPKQYETFCKMLSLGEKLSLPVVIHSRGTTQEIMDMLPSYHLKRILLHWFSNPINLLPQIVERGYYITEGPATTFSGHIQEIVRQMPLERLLTETDGPVRFSKPPFEGRMATPMDIPLVVQSIAKAKNMEETYVAERVYENSAAFFGFSHV